MAAVEDSIPESLLSISILNIVIVISAHIRLLIVLDALGERCSMHKLSLLMGKCGVRLWLLLCQGLNFAWLRRDYLFGSPGLMTFRTQLLRKPHIRRPGHIRLLLLGSGEVHNRLSHYSSVLLLSDVRVIYSSLR